MRTSPLALLGLLALASGAVVAGASATQAQPAAPTDAYVQKIGNQAFVEGKGFPGVVAVGEPTPVMYKNLGPGREVQGFPFWYFYDLGPYTLVVIAQMDEGNRFVTRAVQISGDKAPATSKGARIGDSAERITSLYGQASPLSTTVGAPMFANLVSIDLKTGQRRPLPDAEAAYKNSLWYPAVGTLFVVDGGKVSKIVALAIDDPLPVFLRDPASVRPADGVFIDPKVSEPTWGSPPNDTVLVVPAPPRLAKTKTRGFTLDVPKGWKAAGTRWVDPSGKEEVAVTEVKAPAGEAPGVYFAAQEQAFGVNRLPVAQRTLPPAFNQLLGVDASYALWKQEGGKGKSGQPLRTFALMVAKGDRRLTVVVTRTASGAMPSPDGEALARGVFRSLRLK